MKKILIVPVLLLCLAGASSRKVEFKKPNKTPNDAPINTKVDSLNIKLKELDHLLNDQS